MECEDISVIGSEQLDRSLRLLDSALNSPGKSLLRLDNKKSQKVVRSKETKDSTADSSKFGRSQYGVESMNITQFTRDVCADLTLTIKPHELKKILKDSTGFSSQPHGHQAFKAAQDKLYFDFLEAWQNHSSEQEIFDTILDFVQTCNDSLELMRTSESKTLSRTVLGDDKRWMEIEAERNTWRLIYALYQDRISSELMDEQMEEDYNVEKMSEKEIMLRLYKNNRSVRECQLVIDWLEQNASEIENEVLLEQFTDKTIGWENTLHQLQSSTNIPYKSSREIVNQLDPDAPRRLKKPLHDLDKEDEDRLIHQVFREIRCGRLEEAQDLCVHGGQSWRAAILEGWRLYHDPNYEQSSKNVLNREPLPVEGNPNRDIWKLCAWRLCNDNKIPLKTRAAHAAYCGHLPTLLAASVTWEDHLWSYFKSHVDTKVEREIRENSLKTYVDMPQEYWNNKLTVEEIFSELSASKDPNVKKDSATLDHIVQKYIILDQVAQLMEEVSKWIQGSDMSVGNDVESLSPHFLRFLTHLVLFLRRIGKSDFEDVGDAVIEAYVKLLIEMRESTLVAWYVSQLSQDDQIYYYSAFLEEITEPDERSACLEAAKEAGLNIECITKTVVENIRQQPSSGIDNMGIELQPDVSPEDLVKISALDWLLYYPKQRTELLVQANALIASFLSAGNIQAARLAFNKVPDNTIDTIMTMHVGSQETDDTFINIMLNNIPKHVSAATKEYLCYKAYLDADESFSDWFQHYHHAKPVAPMLKPGANFTEKVGFEHRNNQYKVELERWKLAMENQTKTTKALLFNILLFPGGWLQDEDETEDNDRMLQLSGLRSLIIPKVCLLLHTVMHTMNDYSGCVSLSDVIASHQHQIYKVFSKPKLQDLLRKICESSLALMNENKDSWGFPVV